MILAATFALALAAPPGMTPPAPPRLAPREPLRLALIIGNNESRDEGVKPLRFADDDAARFYELLSAVGYDARLLTVLDPDTALQHPVAAQVARPPSWDKLMRSVAELAQTVQAIHATGGEAELVVTYSGHGAVGERGDPYVSLLDRPLYRGDFFRDVVAAVGADFAHVIIDACRAHDFVDARGGPNGPDFDGALSLFLGNERRAKYPHIGIMVAESADGETHEWSRTRSGIFAHEVLSGLAGGADVNDDGRIEYSELHAFVAAANQAIKDPRARLRVVAEAPTQGARRPLLTLTSGGQAERVRTPASGGRFTVEDERGVRWVDVNQAPGMQVTLHLPRRPRYFVIDVDKAQEATIDGRADSAIVVLSELAFVAQEPTQARGSVSAALASDLFRTPFGASFYEGFALAMQYPSVIDERRVGDARANFPPSSDKPPTLEVATKTAVAHAAALNPLTQGVATPPIWSGWRVARYVSGLGAATTLLAALVVGRTALANHNTAANGYASLHDQEQSIVEREARTADILFGIASGEAAVWGLSWLFCE